MGAKDANLFGLKDMHGNVLEWCLDEPVDYARRGQSGDGVALAGSSDARAARGGAWQFSARSCRSSYRVTASAAYRGNVLGFRPILLT